MSSETTLRERSEIDALVDGKTVLDYFNRNAERFPDQPALHWKSGDIWRHLTWSQYRTSVREAAAGLIDLGVEPGDFVAIMASNRPEHNQADLAALHAGATGVTIYSTLASDQIRYIADDAGVTVAVIEDLGLMKRWEEIWSDLPGLRAIVLLEGAENYEANDKVLSWGDLMARGQSALAQRSQVIDERTASIRPDGLATLIYTSGTTGVPKGVMITHRNVAWTAESIRRHADLPNNPRMVSYLPMAHIAERMATHYEAIYLGGEVHLCPDMTQVLEYIQKSRPQLFVGVPRVWEKFQSALYARFEENEKRDLIHKALQNAIEVVETEQAGAKPSVLARAKRALFDRLVFAKVRAQLGMENVTFSITAAAPISPEVIVFFQAIGLPLFELYGMSENTGPATSNKPDANKIGSVGVPLPGVEVKLGDDGEVLMRGGIVSPGYYNLDEASAETFDADGWLHSGDLGTFDEDGFLTIVGRKKEIIITAAGKNVAPAKLETALKNNPLIAQACMVGDKRKFLSMVIALDTEEAPAWAAAHDIEFTDLASFVTHPEVVAEVERLVEEANAEVARVEQVKRFTIVPDEWTPDTGEITPSLKLKRRVVLDKYADDIERMYAEA